MSERKPLTEIAIGDRVWVSGYRRLERGAILKVEKLTATQIVLERERRYRRGGAYKSIGGHGCIIEIATTEECAEWDKRKEVEAQEAQQRAAERQQTETKRQELHALFGDRDMSIHGDESGWEVTFNSLTEDEVRSLARQLLAEE